MTAGFVNLSYLRYHYGDAYEIEQHARGYLADRFDGYGFTRLRSDGAFALLELIRTDDGRRRHAQTQYARGPSLH